MKVTDNTDYRWRHEYGGVRTDMARQVKDVMERKMTCGAGQELMGTDAVRGRTGTGGLAGITRNRAPYPEGPGFEPLDDGEEASVDAAKRARAKLLAKEYEVDPLMRTMCPGEDEVQLRLPNCDRLRSSKIRWRSAGMWLVS